MSAVLIVGNGFDLNQGLKTSYSDFLKSDAFKKLFRDGPTNSLAQHLVKTNELERWIDVELELSNYARSQSGVLLLTNNFKSEFRAISDALKEFILLQQKTFSINHDTHSFQLIRTLTSESDRGFRVIDFNYTSTIKRILENLDVSIDPVLKKIHGDCETEIIFGVEDSPSLDYKHTFLLKSANPLFDGRSIKDALDQAEELYFFGHSLGQTDHTYFRDYFEFIMTNGSAKIVIYHYGQEGYDQILLQLNVLSGNRLAQLRDSNTIQFKDCSKS